MIGAKEFAIKRKVIEKKKNNPLVDGISIPKFMRSHESDIKNITGSLLDKLKPNSFALPKSIERKEIMVQRIPKMAKSHDTRTINPLIKKTSTPNSMRSHESDIKNIAGSFLDNLKPNGFSLPKVIEHKEIMIKRFPKMAKPHDTRTINPILEESDDHQPITKRPRQKSSFSHMGRDAANTHPFLDFMRSNMEEETKHKEHEEHEECEGFPDELANHITYKVFQNIKSYLEKDSGKSMGNRQIKLEISL